MTESQDRAQRLLGGEEFSFSEAVGGWRGLIESSLPGIVYVVAFLIAGDWKAPVVAALAVVALLVIVRLVQRKPVTQALSGVIGVVIGAIWAWRSGNASDYYSLGLGLNIVYLVGILISMAVRWPVAGIAMGLVHGTGAAWRADAVQLRLAQWGSAALAGMFALRLAVQVPLYLADQTAWLGTAKLVMGVPLFALTLWVVWLLVRNVGRKPESPAPHEQP